MTAWRDIGSAPKDTRVIVWNGEDVCEAENRSDTISGWWSAEDIRDYENGCWMIPQPTHWQPLPAPPAHEGDQ